jgi:hypothetical protein
MSAEVDLPGGIPARRPLYGPRSSPARVRPAAELRSLMAAEGYEFARDVPLGDSPVWQPWHVVEFLRQ